MKHTSFQNMKCPIARSLERVGEWWSMLILRDAFKGLSRFEEFQKSLDITPAMLTRRLNSLVDAGLLERRLYCERPPRYGYHLTACGKEFKPVLVLLQEWGSAHFAPEGRRVVIVDTVSGALADPVLIDRNSGLPITDERFRSQTIALDEDVSAPTDGSRAPGGPAAVRR